MSSFRMFHISRRFYCHKGTEGSRYVKPLSGVKEFLVQKCFAFVQGYEKILETKFPRAFKVYQVFSIGTKTLYFDIKEYIRISSSLNSGKSVRDLQRKELEVYFQIPKDLIKVSPVLLIAALPFANYVILPVIYFFPRLCLTSHFWSLQQKLDFAIDYQRKRLLHYRPVFRHMQAQVDTIEDLKIRDKCQGVFYKIGSGLHPNIAEVIELKCLFVDKPYGIFQMNTVHLHHLCKMHRVSPLPGKQWRLWRHAGFIREMDLAIYREGFDSMTNQELRHACFLRGLNPTGVSKEEIIAWLEQWIFISRLSESKSLSLILHLPIFLSYNAPSNWVLIH